MLNLRYVNVFIAAATLFYQGCGSAPSDEPGPPPAQESLSTELGSSFQISDSSAIKFGAKGPKLSFDATAKKFKYTFECNVRLVAKKCDLIPIDDLQFKIADYSGAKTDRDYLETLLKDAPKLSALKAKGEVTHAHPSAGFKGGFLVLHDPVLPKVGESSKFIIGMRYSSKETGISYLFWIMQKSVKQTGN